MICQISDDDIWFPEHLAEIALLLDEVEFGNTLHTAVSPDNQFVSEFLNLGDPMVQARDRALGPPQRSRNLAAPVGQWFSRILACRRTMGNIPPVAAHNRLMRSSR